METSTLIIGLSGVIACAAPILIAVIGETITERAGVINLSLNGSILLAAMGSFAVALNTQSLGLGFLAGAAIGAAIAFVVAFAGISLKQSQVAVGFVLALACRDLSYFLGSSYVGLSGPSLLPWPVPLLDRVPVLGTLIFNHDPVTYVSILMIPLVWIWMFRTSHGLLLRGIGEQPAAAYVRGAHVNRLRYLYTVFGGALIGFAGASYSLCLKPGWKGTISGLDGIGWIVLAITIFGGWHPLRAALGVYFFALLQWLGLVLQPALENVPSQVLQVAPFPLMILALVLVDLGNAEWLQKLRWLYGMLRVCRAKPPAALGASFENQ